MRRLLLLCVAQLWIVSSVCGMEEMSSENSTRKSKKRRPRTAEQFGYNYPDLMECIPVELRKSILKKWKKDNPKLARALRKKGKRGVIDNLLPDQYEVAKSLVETMAGSVGEFEARVNERTEEIVGNLRDDIGYIYTSVDALLANVQEDFATCCGLKTR